MIIQFQDRLFHFHLKCFVSKRRKERKKGQEKKDMGRNLAMKFQFLFFSLMFLFMDLYLLSVSSQSDHANLPPRGWNSYDSFCWTISEEDFLESTDIVAQRLLPHGYEYVVVDYLWYRKKVPGAYVDSLGFDVIDEWGRLVPDSVRWPSSKDGKGFTEVARKVHSSGLKFGIHVMRGISRQAYDANTRILDTRTGGAFKKSGRQWRARDIGIIERSCGWMRNGFMSVDTKKEAGRAFLRSLYLQYAEWGVDFVKNDCVFGDDLDINEITYVSEVLQHLDRPILYSLSPGTSVTPAMAKKISSLVNLYRITGDDWDTWTDVAAHFDVARDFSDSSMIGSKGLNGKSWPDLDMLPLGWLTDPGSNEGPHRKCNLNLNEQLTQMTLWAMAKSPLMFGGDVRNLDETTYSIITNPTILEINAYSSNNKEFALVTGKAIRTKAPAWQSKRRPLELDATNSPRLILRSCNSAKVNGWSVEALDENLDRICWTGSQEPLCLHKRKSLWTSADQLLYNQGNHLLLASDGLQLCLDASPRKRVTSTSTHKVSFSPCRWDANQLWEINKGGALVSKYSGLCAAVQSEEANDIPTGVRSWIATGRSGEVYIAFFNLDEQLTTISATLSDIRGALPGIEIGATCKGREVWSGNSFVANASISTSVNGHGCALIVLNC